MKLKYIFRKLVWLIALISIIFDSFIFISLPNLPMNIKLNSEFEEISMVANDFLKETDVKLEELEERKKTESESERVLRRKKELLRIKEQEKKLEEEKTIYENSHPIEEPNSEPIICETETTETHENIEWYTIEVSYYCPCYICCGKEDGITASGNIAIEGITVALPSSIPLGTRIVIDGHEYVCQDRGGAIIDYGGNYIRADIYLNSHEDCLARGRYITEGYIIWE